MQPPATGQKHRHTNRRRRTRRHDRGRMRVSRLNRQQIHRRHLQQVPGSLKTQNLILKISATSNPVDLTGSVTDDQFVISADLMFQDPEIDGIILLGLHHMPGLREKYIDGIVKISAKYSKPIVMCDIGETEMALYTRSRFDRLCVPSYSFARRRSASHEGTGNLGRIPCQQKRRRRRTNRIHKEILPTQTVTETQTSLPSTNCSRFRRKKRQQPPTTSAG